MTAAVVMIAPVSVIGIMAESGSPSLRVSQVVTSILRSLRQGRSSLSAIPENFNFNLGGLTASV